MIDVKILHTALKVLILDLEGRRQTRQSPDLERPRQVQQAVTNLGVYRTSNNQSKHLLVVSLHGNSQ